MKIFVVVSTILAVANAGLVLPYAQTAYLASAPLTTKYHSQDVLGQYSYGYNDGLSSKQEVKTFDGITRGSYSYVDAKGEVQTVDYTADALNGFRVAGTNLPKALPQPEVALPEPVRDTPEVVAAREAHLAAIEEAKTGSSEAALPVAPVAPVAPIVELPRPVEDTPEVAAAREAHLAAKKEAELRNSIVAEADATPIVESAPIIAGSQIVHTAGISPYSAGFVLPTLRYGYGIHAPLTYSSNILSYPIIH